MGKADLLKLGLGAAGVGVASDLARPDESEGHSLTQAAIDFAKKSFRKKNPGFKFTPEQDKAIQSIYGVDVPAKAGLKSPAADKVDRDLLLRGIARDDLLQQKPEIINTIRRDIAAHPEEIFSKASPEFSWLPSGTPTVYGGSFRREGGVPKVLLNPAAERPSSLAGHEISHLANYDENVAPFFSKEQLINRDLSLALDKEYMKRAATTTNSAKQQRGLNSVSSGTSSGDLSEAEYFRIPTEFAARTQAKLVSHLGDNDKLSQLKSIDYYLNSFDDATKSAVLNVAKSDPEAFRNVVAKSNISKLAVPLTVAGTFGATSPEEGSASQAKSNIDTSPKIPANVMLGNPEDGIVSEEIKGIPRSAVKGLKTVGKVVADTLEGVGRSGLRIADQGRSGKAFAPKGSDYESLGTAASILLNPAGKAAMTAADVVFDWFNPKELSAGEPDPAKFKQ